jgi:HlyD family secretion protein
MQAFIAFVKRYGRWALGIAVLLALLAGAARWWLGPVVPVDTVQRRDVVQSVVATGRVVAPHRVDLSAQITATVARVPVREGQSVQAGDVLVELQSSEFQALLTQAQAALAQAQARLRQVQEVQAPVAAQALAQADVQWRTAQAQQRRQAELLAQGFIGQAAWDDVQKTLQLAQAQRTTAQKQFDAVQPGGIEVRLAQTAVDQALAAAQAASARSGYTTLKAPVAGVLIGRNIEPGDLVQPGKVLMTLSPAGTTQLVVAIDEKNLHLLRTGQAALASADAYPAQRVSAQLFYINPAVNPQTGAVDVKLDVPEPPAQWMQDMTVSVDIAVDRRDQVVVISVLSLHDKDSAQPWVLQVVAGRAERRPVRLGLKSAGWIEVTQGLAPGDVIVPSSAAVQPGDRVRLASR